MQVTPFGILEDSQVQLFLFPDSNVAGPNFPPGHALAASTEWINLSEGVFQIQPITPLVGVWAPAGPPPSPIAICQATLTVPSAPPAKPEQTAFLTVAMSLPSFAVPVNILGKKVPLVRRGDTFAWALQWGTLSPVAPAGAVWSISPWWYSSSTGVWVTLPATAVSPGPLTLSIQPSVTTPFYSSTAAVPGLRAWGLDTGGSAAVFVTASVTWSGLSGLDPGSWPTTPIIAAVDLALGGPGSQAPGTCLAAKNASIPAGWSSVNLDSRAAADCSYAVRAGLV